MSSLGVYFGPKIISIIETGGKNLINNIQILQSVISASELEEKVPSEIKLVALFKDELRKRKIEAKEVSLALSGRDLVVRTFDMPVMPPLELGNAVRFEAKKYIPFKIEELVCDYQVQFDKALRKNLILFVGIKKEAYERYLSILSQLEIKPGAIEYSGFSLLRLLKLNNCSERGVIAVLSIDSQEDDEANFVVSENNFPLFSRDIVLGESPGIAPEAQAQAPDQGMLFERLKTEIRISLDYYNRKFPGKKIKRLYLISPQDYRQDLEAFVKGMEIAIQFVEAAKFIKEPAPFSLSTLKGYSSSLFRSLKSPLKIDLLRAEEKVRKEALALKRKASLLSLQGILKEYYKVLILGALACIAAFGFGIYRSLPLKKEISGIISQRPKVPGVNSDSTYAELASLSAEYKGKVLSLDKLVKGQLYLTRLLEIAARVKPEGVWLKSFNFKKEEARTELVLEGASYAPDPQDPDKEFSLVNKFLSSLKEDPQFNQYFTEMNIVSLDHAPFAEVTVTVFTIICRRVK